MNINSEYINTSDVLKHIAEHKKTDTDLTKHKKLNFEPYINKMEVNMELKNTFKKVTQLSAKQEKKVPDDTNLNKIKKEVFKTQSGSYLHYRFPDLEPEQALDEILSYAFGAFKYETVNQQTLEENRGRIKNLLRNLIINEVNNPDKFVLYTGISNSLLPLYMTINTLTKYYTSIDDKSKQHFRIKNLDYQANNVEELLKNWEEHLVKSLPETQKKIEERLRTEGKDFNEAQAFQSWINDSRYLGVSFAIDSIRYFQNNGICCNNSLFGNLYNCKGECTLYYFFDSFNANDCSFILKTLFQSASNLPDKEINDLVNQITEAYKRDSLHAAGGALTQILIPKDEIDEQAYLAWAKGMPMRIDRSTGKLATREDYELESLKGGEEKAMEGLFPKVMIEDESQGDFPLAKISDVLEKCIHHPEKIGETFTAVNPILLGPKKGRLSKKSFHKASEEEKNFYRFDSLQTRLVIDPNKPLTAQTVTLKEASDSHFESQLTDVVKSFLGKTIKEEAISEDLHKRNLPLSTIAELIPSSKTAALQSLKLISSHRDEILANPKNPQVSLLLQEIKLSLKGSIYENRLNSLIQTLENLNPQRQDIEIYITNQWLKSQAELKTNLEELALQKMVYQNLTTEVGPHYHGNAEDQLLVQCEARIKELTKLKSEIEINLLFYGSLKNGYQDTQDLLDSEVKAFLSKEPKKIETPSSLERRTSYLTPVNSRRANPHLGIPINIEVYVSIAKLPKDFKLTRNSLGSLFLMANQHTINTPYPFLPEASKKFAGKLVHRPNHNGTHAARQARYLEMLFDLVEKKGNPEYQKQLKNLTSEERLNLELGAYFLRSGRVDEFSRKEDKSVDDYSTRSALIYEQYAKQLNVDPETIEWVKKSIINACKKTHLDEEVKSNPKVKLGYELLTLAHEMDLVRCTTHEKLGDNNSHTGIYHDMKKQVKRLTVGDETQQKKYMSNLFEYSKKVCRTTGERIKYENDKSKRNAEMFAKCSLDGNFCWQQVNTVNIPSW